MNASGISRDGILPGGDTSLLLRSLLYQEYVAERYELMKHKWIESEKAGRDIGLASAIASWTTHHRVLWLKERRARTISAGMSV